MTGCPLTTMQVEIIKLVAEGKTNEEIAIVLGMSVRSVIHKIEMAWRLTTTFNRTQLACKALRQGWIP